jgi:ABC-2 type transport system ATP-binding protein
VVIINNGEIIAQGSPMALRSELERGQPVVIRVDAPIDAVLPAIRALPEVAHAEATLDGIRALPTSPQFDPRPAIARVMSEQGWNLIELRSVAVTLEDIFLEVAGVDRKPKLAQDEPEAETENEVAHE